MQPKSKAIIMLLGAALLWSTGGVLIKGIDWDGVSIAGSRGGIAALLLMALLVRRLPRLERRPLFWLACGCYSGLVINFVIATKLTTAANAIFIQYLAPVYVAALAPFILKERTSRQDLFFIAAALAGMSLFFMDSLSPDGFKGNLLALLSGLCFAGFNISLRRVPDRLKFDIIIWGNIIACLACAPFIDFANSPGVSGWLAVAGMACFQFTLPYYLFARAAMRLTALELTAIPIIEPILNPVLVALVIGEWPGPWAVLGGIIVIVTVTAWSLFKIKSAPRP
ncbi:MAG: DMT family transporter [Desulfarculales bacterium]|jgi:drug/metabolite transporter (DMT)-like permease|nr:DMT family transporter [Desulfarculales bacterium]